ncbi:hypothetical protein BC830DRAFT_177405 [Chytriomyces sp. MP71]|nr:hypothetical protein BC830DRAFT_177405 [Chytriomyces sp. MP71]
MRESGCFLPCLQSSDCCELKGTDPCHPPSQVHHCPQRGRRHCPCCPLERPRLSKTARRASPSPPRFLSASCHCPLPAPIRSPQRDPGSVGATASRSLATGTTKCCYRWTRIVVVFDPDHRPSPQALSGTTGAMLTKSWTYSSCKPERRSQMQMKKSCKRVTGIN